MKTTQELLIQGMTNSIDAHAAEEKTKIGTLRAGMTGCIAKGGQFLGTCPKRAYLRMVGIDLDETSLSKELMYDAGRRNEDHWVESLLKSKEPGLSIKRESEVPISWQLKSGRVVTGRPDIVLFEYEKPMKVLELKLASSLWTARDAAFQLTPKIGHLLQAGHYSWKLGVPAEIWYTARVNFATTGWAAGHMPKPGEPGSQFVEYTYKQSKKGPKISEEQFYERGGFAESKSTIPFIQGFELTWSDRGQLMYRPLGGGAYERNDWVHTLVTQSGIEQFYELADSIPNLKLIPKCVSSITADGTKMSYDLSSYCPLHKAHDCNEQIEFSQWMDKIHAHMENKK